MKATIALLALSALCLIALVIARYEPPCAERGGKQVLDYWVVLDSHVPAPVYRCEGARR